jgi:hypothetical protein
MARAVAEVLPVPGRALDDEVAVPQPAYRAHHGLRGILALRKDRPTWGEAGDTRRVAAQQR